MFEPLLDLRNHENRRIMLNKLQENLNIVGHHTPEVWMECLKQIWHFGTLTEVIYDNKPIETVEIMGLRSQIYLRGTRRIP